MPLGVEQVVRGVLNRSRRGLYGGRTILSGNMISEDGKNKCARCLKFCAVPGVLLLQLHARGLMYLSLLQDEAGVEAQCAEEELVQRHTEPQRAAAHHYSLPAARPSLCAIVPLAVTLILGHCTSSD